MSLDDTQNQVQFEGERNMLYSRFEPSNKTPATIEKLMKFGIVKTREQATYLLVGFFVVALLLSFYLLFFAGTGSRGHDPVPPDLHPSLRQSSNDSHENVYFKKET